MRLTRTLGVTAVLLVVGLLAASVVLAFECPRVINQAKQAVAQAEAALTGIDATLQSTAERYIAMAKAFIQEADDAHKAAAASRIAWLHHEAAVKGKIAKVLAEEVLLMKKA